MGPFQHDKEQEKKLRVCSLDFETGGFDGEQDGITQVSAYWFEFVPGEQDHDCLFTIDAPIRVEGRLRVSPEALKVQGRSAASVFGTGQDEALVFHQFRTQHKSLGNPPILAHAADFEEAFFRPWSNRSQASKTSLGGRGTFLCTVRLAAFLRSLSILKPSGANRLDDCLREYGISRKTGTHDAAEDAWLTARLYVLMVRDLGEYFSSMSAAHVESAVSLLVENSKPRPPVLHAVTLPKGTHVVADACRGTLVEAAIIMPDDVEAAEACEAAGAAPEQE